MRFYRIQDEFTSQINSMLKGEVESVKVAIQGFKGEVTITKENVVTKLGEVSLDKPCFIVSGKQTFNKVFSHQIVSPSKSIDIKGDSNYEMVSGKKSLDYACEHDTYVNCKYNDSNALYYPSELKCEVIFEGILYNFEKISSIK